MRYSFILSSLFLTTGLLSFFPGYGGILTDPSPPASKNTTPPPASKDTSPLAILPASPTKDCGKGPFPKSITMRHREANGIGYNQGYTTLDGFFTLSDPVESRWLPFLDLRGHIFNNGKPAANAGLGLRYLSTSRVWGINGYYDYRKTTHQNYQQFSLGLESLGKVWDFRLNGYLPVGDKTSSFFNTKFDRFKGNYAYLKRKYEFAMKGADAEMGAHWTPCEKIPLYFALGPYYLEGQGKVAWGAKARLAIDLFNYVRLEGNTSYDAVFKWIGQAEVGIRIPLGKRKEIKPQNNRSCSQQLALTRRALQRVDRFEIISTDSQEQKRIAINPTTGEPYVFWFVDNTSHSTGTFESPFNTLVSAQNASSTHDIIYVFPGDGTTTGMDAGITLKDNQKLWGAGISQSLVTSWGIMAIPPQASGMPKLTRSIDDVIICADNNEIAGLYIRSSEQGSSFSYYPSGISCSDLTDIWIHNNTFEVKEPTVSTNGVGISLSDCAGKIRIDTNHFLLTPQFGFGIYLPSSAPSAQYVISNNVFEKRQSSAFTAIEFGTPGLVPLSTFDFIEISKNQFIDIEQKIMGGYGFNGNGRVILDQNVFSHCGTSIPDSAGGAVFFRVRNNANLTIQATDNVWQDSTTLNKPSFSVQTVNSTAKVCLTLKNNSSDLSSNAYRLQNVSGGTFIADMDNNIGPVLEVGTITSGSCP